MLPGLVNIQFYYGKIHHVSWENPLFQWPCSIAIVYKNNGKSPLFMGKSTISMVMFHRFLTFTRPVIMWLWSQSPPVPQRGPFVDSIEAQGLRIRGVHGVG